MNRKFGILLLGFFAGTLLMSLYNINYSGSQSTMNKQAESINLALRQMAHQLYLTERDSNSSIPPVKQISENYFSIELNKRLNYDTLPYLLNQALSDFNIETNYEITIKDCNTLSILLGYNDIAFKNKEISCIGREQSSECNIIGFSFGKKQSDDHEYLNFFAIAIIGIISLFFLKKQNNIKDKYKPPTHETIQLSNSIFTPENLKIIVNEHQKTLTFRESKLLAYFFIHPNQVLNRTTINQHIWGDEGVIVGRSLDVFVSRLRKILKEDPGLNIKTVHGIGYRLEVV